MAGKHCFLTISSGLFYKVVLVVFSINIIWSFLFQFLHWNSGMLFVVFLFVFYKLNMVA